LLQEQIAILQNRISQTQQKQENKIQEEVITEDKNEIINLKEKQLLKQKFSLDILRF